jgi:hypothetical protein
MGSGHAFDTALGAVIFAASAMTVFTGARRIYSKPATIAPVKKVLTNEEIISSLSQYRDSKVLKSDISLALQQVERMKKKKSTLLNLLNDLFSPTEMSYTKFTSVIFEVEKLFYRNLKQIHTKLSLFDESEYNNNSFSKEVMEDKTELYNTYINFVKNSINVNEEILIDLDKLSLEISKLDSFEMEDIENMPAMKEIDLLIEQTKYYRQ